VFTSGYQRSAVTPKPIPRKTIRLGAATALATAAEAEPRKRNDSRNGKAITALLLRRNPRRELDERLSDIVLLSVGSIPTGGMISFEGSMVADRNRPC
jgi:hypothetical protein